MSSVHAAINFRNVFFTKTHFLIIQWQTLHVPFEQPTQFLAFTYNWISESVYYLRSYNTVAVIHPFNFTYEIQFHTWACFALTQLLHCRRDGVGLATASTLHSLTNACTYFHNIFRCKYQYYLCLFIRLRSQEFWPTERWHGVGRSWNIYCCPVTRFEL